VLLHVINLTIDKCTYTCTLRNLLSYYLLFSYLKSISIVLNLKISDLDTPIEIDQSTELGVSILPWPNIENVLKLLRPLRIIFFIRNCK
jgi:hypothetical protein